MARLRSHLTRTYLEIDARSLGLFRLVFGLVLLVDLSFRYRAVEHWYTDAGLLPGHAMTWAEPAHHMFSLFFTLSNAGEVRFAMGLCAIVFGLFTIGYRTRLFHVLSLVCLVSLNTRLLPLESGGDMVMNLLCVWTLFLPLSARFSVDAVLASLRAREEHDADALRDREAMRVGPERVRSLAVLALLAQFVVIYAFNTVQKNGATWIDGSAVHLVLHQDRLVMPFGVWLREHAPVGLLSALSYGTLLLEGLAALLIASPFAVHVTRGLAILLMPALHLAFNLCLDLGIFSLAMASYFPLLLHPRHWEWLRRVGSRLHARRTAFFDAGCGFCFECARLLARLDVLGRVEIVSNQDRERRPSGVDDALVEATLVAQDVDGGRLWTRSDAVAALLRSVPGGLLPALVLRLPGLSSLWRVLYDRVAENRMTISQWLGLAACGLPRQQVAGLAQPPPEPPALASLRRARHRLAELAVACLIVISGVEVLNANPAVPEALRVTRPAAFAAVIEYPRILQGWSMFAPDAPRQDQTITVEATTAGGRLVDPYAEASGTRPLPVPLTEIPTRLGQDQFFTAYSLFLPRPDYRRFRNAFRDWILRYPERTGRPEDHIVSFVAFRASDVSPPPGKRRPTHFRKIVFMRHPR